MISTKNDVMEMAYELAKYFSAGDVWDMGLLVKRIHQAEEPIPAFYFWLGRESHAFVETI